MSEENPKKGVFRRIGVVRLLIFFFVLALAYGGPQFLVQQELLPRVAADQRVEVGLAAAVLSAIFLICIYALLVGLAERRHILELSLRRGVPLFVGGIVLAFVMFASVYAVLWAMHVATWLGIFGFAGIVPFVTMALISGIGEELIFRGGVYRILEDMFGTAVALVLSGALFGALHLANPHATWFSSLAIAIEAGVLLGAAYAATRSLWLPIGIHAGWNFTEGGVFGATVSGHGASHGIVKMPLHGPELLTGGAFGPEASVVALAICSLAGLFFLVQTIRRGRWVGLSFHMLLD